MAKNKKKSFLEELEYKLDEKWDDEKILKAFTLFTPHVDISSHFIEDDDGLITHQLLMLKAGDLVLSSDPQPLDWPLTRLPVPDAFKGSIN